MLKRRKVSAIILAGGNGERFGSTIPKQFMSLNGRSVIDYSIEAIEPEVDEVIVVANKPYKGYKHALAGLTRSSSVASGLAACKGAYVVIHDAARPYVERQTVRQVVDLLKDGILSVDTAVPITDGYLYNGIPEDKSGRYLSQTPEGFDVLTLKTAFNRATRSYQDEVTMVWDTLGVRPELVPGVELNSKLTVPGDLEVAEGVLKFRSRPIATKPRQRKTLVLGGTGGIGGAIVSKLQYPVAFGSQDLNLAQPFDLNLKPYKAIVHAAGSLDDEMAVNFYSCLHLISQALQQGWKGNIVFLSSTAATYGRPDWALYSCSKAALNTYIEAKHEALAEQGIFINAIAPAKTNTKLMRRMKPDVTLAEMIEPEVVADYILPYLDTQEHGHIIYIRKGME